MEAWGGAAATNTPHVQAVRRGCSRTQHMLYCHNQQPGMEQQQSPDASCLAVVLLVPGVLLP